MRPVRGAKRGQAASRRRGDRAGAHPASRRRVAAGGHHGAAYTITGPAAVTVREQVRAIGVGLGEEVRYEEVTREEARALMYAQGGFAAQSADLMLGFVEYGGDAPDTGSGYAEQDWSALMRPWPDVEKVTGHPARTFAEWARDHADDFR